jgi:hypothetical protein
VAGPSARSLTEGERDLLHFLLGVEFPGVAAFREQARHVEDRRGSGPWDFLDFGLDVDRSLTGPATLAFDVPWVVTSSYRLPDGTPGGECILFQADGWLDAVEITWYGDDPPSTLPPLSLCSPPEPSPLLSPGTTAGESS